MEGVKILATLHHDDSMPTVQMAPHCCRDTIASTAGVLVRRPMANVACLDVALPLTTPDTFAYGERGHLVNLSSGGANSSAENSFSDHVVIRGVDVDAHNSASMVYFSCSLL